MFLRWEVLRGWMPAIVFAAIAVAIEVLYFNYMVSRGMMDEAFTISLGALKIPLSIALFFSLANAIVLLTLWMSVFENTAFVMAGPDRRVKLVYQRGSFSLKLNSVVERDGCQLLHMVIRASQNGLLGQVCLVPAFSRFLFNRGLRAAPLESKRNQESHAGSPKEEVA